MSMASWRAADALAPSVAVASVFRASRRSSAGVAGEPSFATAAGSLAAGEKGLARSWTRLGPITAGGAAAVPAAPAGEARARRARAPTAQAAPARRDRPGNLPLVTESLRLTCPTRSGADRLVARLVEARSATFGKPLGRAQRGARPTGPAGPAREPLSAMSAAGGGQEPPVRVHQLGGAGVPTLDGVGRPGWCAPRYRDMRKATMASFSGPVSWRMPTSRLPL